MTKKQRSLRWWVRAVTCAALVSASAWGCRPERRVEDGPDTGGDDGGTDTESGIDTESASETGTETETDIDTSWSVLEHPLEVEWVRCFGEPADEWKGYGNDLAVLSDGRVAITGRVTEPDGSFFLAVLEADGSDAWTADYTLPGEGDSWITGYSVSETPGGDLLVAGRFAGQVALGGGASAAVLAWDGTGADAFLARYGSGGELEWAASTASPDSVTAACVSPTPNGSSVVTGSISDDTLFGGTDQTSNPELAGSGGYVVRYTPSGNPKSAVKIAAGARPASLVAWPDGRVTVGGLFHGSEVAFGEGDPNETLLSALGWEDVFFAGYSVKSELAWVKRVAGGQEFDSEVLFDLTAFDESTFVAVGHYTETAVFDEGGPAETHVSNGGMTNGFLARYGTDGSLVWARSFGGDWDDGARAVATDGAAIFVVGKSGYLPAVFGAGEPNQTVLFVSGWEDYDQLFVARYRPEGDLDWAWGVPHSQSIQPWGAALTPDGGLVVGGHFNNEVAFGQDEAGEWVTCTTEKQKPFVVKYRL
jgi:hypothetical protein